MDTEEKTHTEALASGETVEATEKGLRKTKTAIINAIDENGNGEIDIEDVIVKGLRIPGIRINRTEFLQKQLFKCLFKVYVNINTFDSFYLKTQINLF